MPEPRTPMQGSKPRILLITRNLPPLLGGMERLNQGMLRELGVDFEVAVCCPDECLPLLPRGMEARGAPLRPLSRFVAGTAWNAVRLARRFRPQLVLAGSGLTAPLARLAARASGAKAAAYLHGLDIVVDQVAYARLWVPQFRKLDLVLVNSRHTAGLATAAGVPANRLRILHPGVEMPVPNEDAQVVFRQRFGIGARPILLSVGRLTARKGLAEFIETVLPGLAAAVPGVLLVVIGGEATQSLKVDAQGQRQRLVDAVARHGLHDQVLLLGEQDEPTLHAAFGAASALVFPVLDLPGDIEGFGMVAIEAAAQGLPTVAFAVGGVVDAISVPQSGVLIPSGQYPQMLEALKQSLSPAAATPQARRGRREFAARFEWSRFGEQLRATCLQAIGG